MALHGERRDREGPGDACSGDVTLTPIEPRPDMASRLKSASDAVPVSRQHAGEALWFTILQDKKTVYVNFRRYDSIDKDAKAMFAFLDESKATRLVIDLRQNGGGDFYKGRRPPRGARQAAAGDQRQGAFLRPRRPEDLLGGARERVDFRKETRAILVGEPIGERPNSYSENDEMTLPHSKLVVSYSTRYYRFSDEDVPAVLPDVRIDPTWPDFKAGRDAVLEWVLAHE